MQRDDTIRTLHILEAARKALHFVENKSRDDLDKDEILAISLFHLLEIIGESANCVSAGFREQHPHIPWKKMVELRNRLIHGYFEINLDIVWDTVLEDLPPLVTDIEKIIPYDELP